MLETEYLVIVGSAIVRIIAEPGRNAIWPVQLYIQNMRQAIDQVSRYSTKEGVDDHV